MSEHEFLVLHHDACNKILLLQIFSRVHSKNTRKRRILLQIEKTNEKATVSDALKLIEMSQDC